MSERVFASAYNPNGNCNPPTSHNGRCDENPVPNNPTIPPQAGGTPTPTQTQPNATHPDPNESATVG